MGDARDIQREAAALHRAATDDSQNEPPDFDDDDEGDSMAVGDEREGSTTILRIRTEQTVPEPWQIRRILGTWTVPNNDGGTGWHYEYDVEVVAGA